MKVILTPADLLVREIERFPQRQAVKILTSLNTAKAVARKVTELVRKRHARRGRRLMQKASRQRNRA